MRNKYGLTHTSIGRHTNNCLKLTRAERLAVAEKRVYDPHRAARIGQVVVAAVLPTRDNLIGRLEQLSERVDALAIVANEAGRDGVALAALSEIRKTISDIARIAGHDRPAVAVQVNSGPDVAIITDAVLAVLRAEVPLDQQAVLLPALAQRLKSIAGSSSEEDPASS